MPLPVEGLTPTSTKDQVKQAIGASISQCVSEGRPQDQCVAMVYQMAEKATGQSTGSLAGPGMEWG